MSDPAGSRRRWLPPALWAGVVVVSSSWPNPNVGDVPEGSDKITHFLLYGVLALLLGRAERALVGLPLRAAATLAAVSAFAALDEWHQRFIPGRSASTADWVADSAGAAVALVGLALARRGTSAAA